MRKNLLYALIIATAGSSAAYADSIEFSHSSTGNDTGWFGTGKRETYDVAIHMADPGLAGYRITGIKVPFRETANVSGLTGWLSSELKLVKDENDWKINMPDITSAEMEYADGWVTTKFDPPYELTKEGIYAGYTFTVNDVINDKALKTPVAVTNGSDPDALFIRTNRTYTAWSEQSAALMKKSCIVVLLEGESPRNSVGLRIGQTHYLKAGEPSVSIPVSLVMHGTDPLEHVTFSYEISSPEGIAASGETTATLDTPVALPLGKSHSIDISLPASIGKGTYTLRLEATKANTATNEDISRTASCTLVMLSDVPVHRPLTEEYTGTWCGNCPRGYASMEHMAHKYPGEFISIAYHCNDDMQCVRAFPSAVSGYPVAYIDRTTKMDPYFGTTGDYDESYGFEADWLKARARFTPIAVDVSAAFDESDPDLITVTSHATLVHDSDKQYSLAYALLADGLQDPDWAQQNYFAGSSGYKDLEEMDMFINGKTVMSGLAFNDVIVAHSDLLGVAASIPYPMEIDRRYTHTHTFRVSECNNISKQKTNLVQDRNRLRVVAMVCEANGAIANSAASKVEAATGLNPAAADSEVISTVYYDLCGNMQTNPSQGIYIRADRLSNGTMKFTKVAIPGRAQ